MKNQRNRTIAFLLVGLFTVLTGCEKSKDPVLLQTGFEDSIFYELEYNSLDFDNDTVDFDMDGINDQT